jgi:hypothetical protein
VEYGKEYDILDKTVKFKIKKLLDLGGLIYLENM